MSKRVSLAPPPIPLDEGWSFICNHSNRLLAKVGDRYATLRALLEAAGADIASGAVEMVEKKEAKEVKEVKESPLPTLPGAVGSSRAAGAADEKGTAAVTAVKEPKKEEKKEWKKEQNILTIAPDSNGIAVVTGKNGEPEVALSAGQRSQLHT